MGGCKAEVYAGICRPWLYLTFRSGGMFDSLFFNLAGGLFGAFGILDIVGRWGRVAPMKKKSFDLKKDGGECPELVLLSQVIPNSYWIFLSFEALAKRSCAKSRNHDRPPDSVVGLSYEILLCVRLSLCREGHNRES